MHSALSHPSPGTAHIPTVQACLCSAVDFSALTVLVWMRGPGAAFDGVCYTVCLSISKESLCKPSTGLEWNF